MQSIKIFCKAFCHQIPALLVCQWSTRTTLYKPLCFFVSPKDQWTSIVEGRSMQKMLELADLFSHNMLHLICSIFMNFNQTTRINSCTKFSLSNVWNCWKILKSLKYVLCDMRISVVWQATPDWRHKGWQLELQEFQILCWWWRYHRYHQIHI